MSSEHKIKDLKALKPTYSPSASILTCTELELNGRGLKAIPQGLGSLTSLIHLSLENNQLNFLPLHLSALTGLTFLNINKNLIEELPDWLPLMSELKMLVAETGGKFGLRRAPSGITALPCWNCLEKHGDIVIANALRRLELYSVAAPNQTQRNSRASIVVDVAPLEFHEPTPGEYVDVLTTAFSSEDKLGEGGFGEVFCVRVKRGVVAVKVPKKETKPSTAEFEELTREARIMITLNHTNIIRLYGYGYKDRKVFYVLEYADGKSVQALLDAIGGMPFPLASAYAAQVNAGLAYLHSRTPPVEHRDLKPENVLVCDGVAKICDFGMATARETVSRTTGFAGTYHFVAPESFDFRGYGPMSDMYSFGCVVWAMLTGQRPYDGLPLSQIMAQKTSPDHSLDIPEACPLKMAAVVRECWRINPRERPTAADLAARLDEIRRDPGPSAKDLAQQQQQQLLVSGADLVSTQVVKRVRDMDCRELAEFLQGRGAHHTCVSAVRENDVVGRDFVDFDEEILMSAPFALATSHAKAVLAIIRDVLEDEASD